MQNIYYFLFILVFISGYLGAQEKVVVDLIDPVYEQGVLSTEWGGVVTAENMRIQAQKIAYSENFIQCSGNLLVDYNGWTLAAEAFHYDFALDEGLLINARTASPPWYISGEEIRLNQGVITILNGTITTSEGEVQDVAMRSSLITLSSNRTIDARHVTIRIHELPLFWLPFLKLTVDAIEDFPFSVRYGWGGFLGSYMSLRYRLVSWNDLRAYARLDTFFGKGIGLAIETAYAPKSRSSRFFTRNLYAHDIALDDPSKHDRYRFQGRYSDRIADFSIDGTYDFVSDAEMASGYTVRDFDLETAGMTQLAIRKETRAWKSTLFTRVRVNNFQSVNQALPAWRLTLHPFEIARTGIISEQNLSASYLSARFSQDVANAHNFSSMRLAASPFFYRPFNFPFFTLTPEAGLIAIAYSDTPNAQAAFQAVGRFGAQAHTTIARSFTNKRHTLEPYLHYTYLTPPTSPLDSHYIFSIEDGYTQLNLVKFGTRSALYIKKGTHILCPIWGEVWANAFFANPYLKTIVPRGYLNARWLPLETINLGLESGWNFEQGQLDFFKARIAWTVNEHIAAALELSKRGPFDWRKADFTNFMLDAARSQEELLRSPLSDPRTTLLLNFFIRPNPDWTSKLELRLGRLDRTKRSYFEYFVELNRILFQHWQLTFAYEKKESDNRFSFALHLKP